MSNRGFKKGDRVCSNVLGFYMGSPATVIGLSQVQFGTPKRYDIELDIGKRATLRADRLKKLNKEDKSYE